MLSCNSSLLPLILTVQSEPMVVIEVTKDQEEGATGSASDSDQGTLAKEPVACSELVLQLLRCLLQPLCLV